MVDDTLGFSDDFAQYSLTHESVTEFIKNDELWQNQGLKELLTKRELVIGNLVNDTKNLQFLSQNKLVFLFQKKIVTNMNSNREHKKYERWFDFALKTRNKNNNRSDFEKFKEDSIFREMMRRLKRDDLKEEDIRYIEEEDEFIRLSLDFYQKQSRKIEASREEGIELGRELGREEGIVQERARQDEFRRQELEKERVRQEDLRKQNQLESAKKMLHKGLSSGDISEITGLSISEIEELKNRPF